MRYLLDSNVVIGVMKMRPDLLAALQAHRAADCAISSLVLHELFFGAYKSQRREANLADVDLLSFAVLDFDRSDARCAAEIRAALRACGTPIGPYDVLIAGQALARGLILITNNVAEFSRVEGLRVEDWQR
ncbi:MAG: VapC toxin family PIN domain ribonuclease [Bosea sp. 12-68-7]|nr:MAG: VapC toxin family PIN domain ribonuclease [Bosea sp. 12-68-7]OYX02325.1 MAG: VapC toxin family PIN domain ribonuclease [Bosea sp. 32-68-6]